MVGVQIIGLKDVMTRYEKLDCTSWALLQGKQFIASGDSAGELQEWLNDFHKTGTTATFTLRAYDTEAPTAATVGADYLASVNFKLVDTYEGEGIAGYSNKLMQRLDALEKKFESGAADDNDEPGLLDIVMGWLEEPDKLGAAIGAIKQLWTSAPPAVTVGMPVKQVQMAGIGKVDSGTDDDRLLRLSRALDILEQKDPNLIEHLEKLAKLATDSPITFSAILDKLNGL